jgi:hypothetical protein
VTSVPAHQRTTDPSLLHRLEIAAARNREIAEDNQRLRRQLAQALDELRAAGVKPPPGHLDGDPVSIERVGLDLADRHQLGGARDVRVEQIVRLHWCTIRPGN